MNDPIQTEPAQLPPIEEFQLGGVKPTEDWALKQSQGRTFDELPTSHLILLKRRFARVAKRGSSSQIQYAEAAVRGIREAMRKRGFD